MYVDGLKHNLFSVSEMRDQGNEVVFRSNGCVVRELDTAENMIKVTRTANNLYILKGGQQRCYLKKMMKTSCGIEDWDIKSFLKQEKHADSRLFVIFQISSSLKIKYANDVKSIRKPELNSLKKKGQLVSLLNLSILIYVDHQGKSHLVEKNTLFFSLMIFPECVG